MFSNVDKQMKSWVNPFSLGSIINMAGTEMHTNYAMLRQFSWAFSPCRAPAALWLGRRGSRCPLRDRPRRLVLRDHQEAGDFPRTPQLGDLDPDPLANFI